MMRCNEIYLGSVLKKIFLTFKEFLKILLKKVFKLKVQKNLVDINQ